MDSIRIIEPIGAMTFRRFGRLCLGPVREVCAISLCIGLAIAAIWQLNGWIEIRSLAPGLKTPNNCFRPLCGIDIDRERQSIVIQTWPCQLNEVSLDSGYLALRKTPTDLVSTATSEYNSTTIMLSQWAGDEQINQRVSILRRNEVLLSEEVRLVPASCADVHISEDGTVAALVSHEGQVLVWDLSMPVTSRREFQFGCSMMTSQLSPDGQRIFLANTKGKLSIHDTSTCHELLSLPLIPNCTRCVQWTSDGQFLAIGDHNGRIYLFETRSGSLVWKETIKTLFVRCIAISPNGQHLAVGHYDKQVLVWDLTKPSKPPQSLVGHQGVVRGIVFTSNDKTLISASHDGTIREWSVDTGKQIRQIY